MSLYLILPLPALLAALFTNKLTRWELVMIWIATSLLMVWLIPIGSRDYATYLSDFSDFNELPFTEVIRQDPIYAAALWMFGHLGGSAEVFYLTLAAISLWIKLTALRRLTDDSSIVVLVYLCSYFFLHDFTQIRAGIAIGIWMHALVELPYSRRGYIVLTMLASLIHLQAAIGFVLLGALMVTRTRLGVGLLAVLTLIIVGLASTPIFDQLASTALSFIPDARAEIYLELASEGVWERPNPYSLINLLSLSTALTGLYLLERHRLVPLSAVPSEYSTSRAVYISLLLGVCALAALTGVPVAAFRISEHFFSLLPVGVWMVTSHDEKEPRYPVLLWLLAGILVYIFLFYSPYLLDPAGEGLSE